MKEEQIGHYGRTYNGRILKYVNFVDEYKKIESRKEVINNRITNTIDEEIVKSSKNIIDLVEVGDILIYKNENVKKIYEIDNKLKYYLIDDCVDRVWEREEWMKDDLVSILTHEQLAEIEYRVEEK